MNSLESCPQSMFMVGLLVPLVASGQNEIRVKDLEVTFSRSPGPLNSITDVEGIAVGHTTLISGGGPLEVGNARFGQVLPPPVHPRNDTYDPVFAGCYALNSKGEMTGTTWVEESAILEGLIMITNTHSVRVARDATIESQYAKNSFGSIAGRTRRMLVAARCC